jgi:hypothetical protein
MVKAVAAAAGHSTSSTASLQATRHAWRSLGALKHVRPSDWAYLHARLNEALMALGDPNPRGYSAALAGGVARTETLAAQQAPPPPSSSFERLLWLAWQHGGDMLAESADAAGCAGYAQLSERGTARGEYAHSY